MDHTSENSEYSVNGQTENIYTNSLKCGLNYFIRSDFPVTMLTGNLF